MNMFKNIIKGMMIGIANIMPGVSGGTLAVSMGIYDKLQRKHEISFADICRSRDCTGGTYFRGRGIISILSDTYEFIVYWINCRRITTCCYKSKIT